MRSTIFVLGLMLAATVFSAENVTIQVQGMSCGSCAASVKSALKGIDGVSDARVSYEQGQAVVTYDSTKTTPEAIARAVEVRLPGYKLVVGGGPVRAAESPKGCARPAAAGAALVERSQVDSQRVTFYEVGLVCTAAPKIGCGSRSKPVLLSLIGDRRVAGAWLNEAGTRVAIGWKNSHDVLSPDQLDQLLAGKGVAIHPVAADTVAELLASFESSGGWFDAASVDRLSEQEAGIIAARLVKRLAARTAITAEQDTTLRKAIEQACRKRFIDGEDSDLEAQFLAVAKAAHLDAQVVAALREVVALGYRPLPNEE
ncbi:MAG TPA: cation transporter [Thermoanaerobaculia bacterium]|nr:cation transporter [Thermoanaerobaculia bacterium]